MAENKKKCQFLVETSGIIVVKDGDDVVYEGKSGAQATAIYESLLDQGESGE